MGNTSVSRWCPTVETVAVFCSRETLKDTVCLLIVEMHDSEIKLSYPLFPPFLQALGHDKQSLDASLSSTSLSQLILLLDLCGVSGIVLVFPVGTSVNDVSRGMWCSFTVLDPLVDLRDNLGVVAVCPNQRQMRFIMQVTSVRAAEVFLEHPGARQAAAGVGDSIITYQSLQAKGKADSIKMRLYHVSN